MDTFEAILGVCFLIISCCVVYLKTSQAYYKKMDKLLNDEHDQMDDLIRECFEDGLRNGFRCGVQTLGDEVKKMADIDEVKLSKTQDKIIKQYGCRI